MFAFDTYLGFFVDIGLDLLLSLAMSTQHPHWLFVHINPCMLLSLAFCTHLGFFIHIGLYLLLCFALGVDERFDGFDDFVDDSVGDAFVDFRFRVHLFRDTRPTSAHSCATRTTVQMRTRGRGETRKSQLPHARNQRQSGALSFSLALSLLLSFSLALLLSFSLALFLSLFLSLSLPEPIRGTG